MGTAGGEKAKAKTGGEKAGRRWPMIVGIIAGLAIAIGLAVFAAFRMGLLVPGDAAAKYHGDQYLSEQRVTDYIESYRKQQGLEGSTDVLWAGFLADNNLTPESLRVQTIQQLVIDEMVKLRAAERGVSIDEAEFREYLDTFKGNLAFGDEKIYRETLEMQGQTVESAEEGFRTLFLERALFEVEVPIPEPTDEEIQTGLLNAYPNGIEAKHIYRFSIDGLDEGSNYEHIEAAQKARQAFVDAGPTVSHFEQIVEQYSNDEELVRRLGDDGWSIDMTDESSEYQDAVEALSEGECSPVFVDGNRYTFLWIDRVYHADKTGADGGYDVRSVPADLLQEITDGIANAYWQLDCQVYLQKLLAESGLEIYPMPSNVSYNVDMSLAEGA